MPKRQLNVRGHVRAKRLLRGADRRCDCDGYRPYTLGGGIGIRGGFVTRPEVMIETIAPIFMEEI